MKITMKIPPACSWLPEPITSFFFRSLGHRWRTAFTAVDGLTCEQKCSKCGTHRHYLPQHCKTDGMSAEWQSGPLPTS